MIHVIFSSSAAGSLRQALRAQGLKQKVVNFTDNLDFGPIEQSDFSDREAWLDSNVPTGMGSWDWIRDSAERFVQELRTSDQHLVWIAPQDASELCGLHWYLDLFGGEEARFNIVDHGFPGTWKGEKPIGLGELRVELFQWLLENKKPGLLDKHRFPRARWAELSLEGTNLRIVQEGGLANAPDDYFDGLILSNCSKEWKVAHRIVGDSMIALWERGHSANDSFIFWRLRVLAQECRIEASGDILPFEMSHGNRPKIRLSAVT